MQLQLLLADQEDFVVVQTDVVKSIIKSTLQTIQMKKIIYSIAIIATLSASAQNKKLKNTVVEASCGMCQLGTTDKSCSLSIRYQGKVYTVTGTDIHKHGDAHAVDGFCNAIRKAKVSGEIKDNEFVLTSFILLPNKE